jgi:hypothetical protein
LSHRASVRHVERADESARGATGECENVAVANYDDEDLQNSSIENLHMDRSLFRRVFLNDSTFDMVDFSGSTFSDVDLVDVEIHGVVRNLRINDVAIGPYIEAELDRRYPGREKMRPTTADGFRDAWALVESLWAATIERARQLDPALRNERVNGEWSFLETLRHLVYASDVWIRRALCGDPTPWHPLDLPFDGFVDEADDVWTRDARPSLDEVLALRADRSATVTSLLRDLTDARLDERTTPVEGSGWPPPDSYVVRNCLGTVLNEEWEHRRYAERDLDILTRTSHPDVS